MRIVARLRRFGQRFGRTSPPAAFLLQPLETEYRRVEVLKLSAEFGEDFT